jgi:hypothetical protein
VNVLGDVVACTVAERILPTEEETEQETGAVIDTIETT